MKISKLFITGFTVVLLLVGCNKKENQFSVSGTISHAEGETLYFEKLLVSSSERLDSAKLDESGAFQFRGETKIPAYYLLKFSENKFITLLIDSAEQVNVEADYANFERNYLVECSLGSIQVKELSDHFYKTQQKLDSLQSLHNLYKGNPDYPALRKEWIAEGQKIRDNQTEFSTQFVMNNPFSMASVLALYQKFDNEGNYVVNDLQTMRVAASALNSIYPESAHVKALYQNTLQLLKEEQNAQVQKIIQEHGQNSPEIVLPNPEGEEIALSHYVEM